MKIRVTLTSTLFISILFCFNKSHAQCAMCTLNAENSVKEGNTQGKGLNTGIFYLLAAPYLAVMGVGFIWYKRYRSSNERTSIKPPNYLN